MSRAIPLLALAAGFVAASLGVVEDPDSLAFLALTVLVVGVGIAASERIDVRRRAPR